MTKELDKVLREKINRLFSKNYTPKEAYNELKSDGIDISYEFCVFMHEKFHNEQANILLNKKSRVIASPFEIEKQSSWQKSINIRIKF